MQEDEFITQHIAEKKQKRKKMMGIAGKAALAGASFALGAAVVAFAACPMLAKRWKAAPGKESVRIERDESEGAVETNEQISSPVEHTEGSGEESAAVENKNVREQVEQVLESRNYELSDLRQMAGTLRKLADSADASVVSVTHEQAERDWFNNALESSENYAGLAVAKTENELLFLTTSAAVEGTESVTVTLSRGDKATASVKMRDKVYGLAVLSVPITDENRESWGKLPLVPFGNSYRLKRGELLFFVGSPLGMIHSVKYGILSNVQTNVSVVDGYATIYFPDVSADATSGSWVLNADGELVGWVTDLFSEKGENSTATVMGLSDFKPAIERMMNGKETALLGIYGRQVGSAQRDLGMPAGVYISRVEQNTPAYAAGVQPGDILISLGETKIQNMRDLESAMEKLAKGEALRLTLMRNGREKYETITLTATLAGR